MSPSGIYMLFSLCGKEYFMDELTKRLQAPFLSGEIEWRLQNTTQDGSRGLAVPYVDNRAIQNRLDEIFTPFGWKNDFTQWQGGNSQLCSISVLQNGEWITKTDGAENTDIEPIKGGLSDSMKRAAVQFGIGRYLYQMEGVWVEVEKVERKGKSTYLIKKSEFPKLDQAYEKAVKEIFKQEPDTSKNQSKSKTDQGKSSKKAEKENPKTSPGSQQTDNVQEQKIIIKDRREVKKEGKELLKFITGDGEIMFALDNLDYFRSNDEIPESMVEFTIQNNCKIISLKKKDAA